MADEAKVASFRERYSGHSDSSLIRERDSWIDGTPERIAAEQLLHERAMQQDEQRHVETLSQTRRANNLALAAIWIAVLSLLLAIMSLFIKGT